MQSLKKDDKRQNERSILCPFIIKKHYNSILTARFQFDRQYYLFVGNLKNEQILIQDKKVNVRHRHRYLPLSGADCYCAFKGI